MLISTFELLLAAQIPESVTDPKTSTEISLPVGFLSRPIIQGYFLTIANLEEIAATLVINFKAVTTPPNRELIDLTATLLDVKGANIIGDLLPTSNNAYQYEITLPANTTCLFIFQPEPKREFLKDLNIELRGYADIELAKATSTVKLLITPEHRGTFFAKGISNNTPRSNRQLGEIAYSLPTANGGSLFTLEPSTSAKSF